MFCWFIWLYPNIRPISNLHYLTQMSRDWKYVCVCVCVCIGAKANQLISVPIRTRLFPLLDCYCAYYWWISIGDAPELSFLISTRLQIPPIVSKQWKTLLSILLGEGAGEEEGEGVCPSASLPPTLIFIDIDYIKWSAGEQSRHVSI